MEASRPSKSLVWCKDIVKTIPKWYLKFLPMSMKWDQKKKNQIGTFQNKANITCQNGIINNSMQGVHWIFNFNICTKNHSIRTKEIASLSSWRQRAVSLQLEINSILWQSVNSYTWLGIFPNSRIILNLNRKYLSIYMCVC